MECVTPGDYINLQAKICTKSLNKNRGKTVIKWKSTLKTKELYYKIETSSFIFTFSNYMTSLSIWLS